MVITPDVVLLLLMVCIIANGYIKVKRFCKIFLREGIGMKQSTDFYNKARLDRLAKLEAWIRENEYYDTVRDYFRHLPDGIAVSASDVERVLRRVRRQRWEDEF